MTMCDPYGYVSDLENEPYERLIKERDELIREIKHFEKHKKEIMKSEEAQVCPSPSTVYSWNKKALGYLDILIDKRLREADNQEGL